ncbi:hypothetical protein ACFORJ_08065 [Corynebacterium hansenii]|uniref:MFS transporter n=1 Tax=Corynebacterium hansenii TaxID=394964 RepID=A0ABV7ZPM6_9CORY|nr:hypothetical protein [Corynebacterium hansenii]WJZ00706.1 hypothetical protein CHAN_10530 [Corynebacterium hansenii]
MMLRRRADGSAAPLKRLLTSAAAVRFAGAAELVVLNWWVLAVTGDPRMIGVATAARLVPLLFAGPVAGAIADRGNPARLLLWMGCAATVATVGIAAIMAAAPAVPTDPSSAAPAAATAATAVAPAAPAAPWAWAAIGIIGARSLLTAPEPAIRQIAVTRATGEGGMVRGMSDLATIGTLSLIVGPMVSGLLLAASGPVAAMMPVLVAHAAGSAVILGSVERAAARGGGSVVKRDRESPRGLRAALRAEPLLGPQIALAIGPMLAVFPYTAMIPVVFADGAFGARGVGAAAGSASAALGAVAATLWLRKRKVRDPGRWAAVSAAAVAVPVLVAGGALVVAGQPPSKGHLLAALAAFAVLGAIGQIYRTTNRLAVIALSPPDSRGAVLGFASADRVLIPAGAIVCGAIAAAAGPGMMLIAMAVADLVLVAAVGAVMLRRGRSAGHRP